MHTMFWMWIFLMGTSLVMPSISAEPPQKIHDQAPQRQQRAKRPAQDNLMPENSKKPKAQRFQKGPKVLTPEEQKIQRDVINRKVDVLKDVLPKMAYRLKQSEKILKGLMKEYKKQGDLDPRMKLASVMACVQREAWSARQLQFFLRKDDLDTKSLVILASGTLHKALEHLAPRLQGYVEVRPDLLSKINRIEHLNSQMWEGVLKGIPKLNTKKSQKRQ